MLLLTLAAQSEEPGPLSREEVDPDDVGAGAADLGPDTRHQLDALCELPRCLVFAGTERPGHSTDARLQLDVAVTEKRAEHVAQSVGILNLDPVASELSLLSVREFSKVDRKAVRNLEHDSPRQEEDIGCSSSDMLPGDLRESRTRGSFEHSRVSLRPDSRRIHRAEVAHPVLVVRRDDRLRR